MATRDKLTDYLFYIEDEPLFVETETLHEAFDIMEREFGYPEDGNWEYAEKEFSPAEADYLGYDTL